MKKINTIIDQNISLIMLIFLFCLPVLDVITALTISYGTLGIRLSQIIKTLFLGFMVYDLLFIKGKKSSNFIILGLGLFSIGYLVVNHTPLLNEISILIKFWYFPITVLFLLANKNIFKEITYQRLLILTLIYLLLLFIPNILFDNQSYGIVKKGERGLFYSANELGAILAILFPVCLYYFYEKKQIVSGFIFSVFYFYNALTMGTKTPVLAILITIFMAVLFLFIDFMKQKRYKIVAIMVGLFITGTITFFIIIPQTIFYQNIKSHMTYFKIDNFKEIFTDYENLDNIIFSQRLAYLGDEMSDYPELKVSEKLFGQGAYTHNKVRKVIESDYYDTYFTFGIIGTVIYLLFFIVLMHKKIFNDLTSQSNNGFQFAIVLIFIIIPFFAGHVYFSPSAIFIYLISLATIFLKKEIKD